MLAKKVDKFKSEVKAMPVKWTVRLIMVVIILAILYGLLFEPINSRTLIIVAIKLIIAFKVLSSWNDDNTTVKRIIILAVIVATAIIALWLI